MTTFRRTRGDTLDFKFQVIRPNATNPAVLDPVNLTTAALRFTVRAESATGQVVKTLTYGVTGGVGGITVTNATSGTGELTLQTATLAAGGYVYDLELTEADGKVTTIDHGLIFLEEDVTDNA